MGDGSRGRVCNNPGVAYQASVHKGSKSPQCGYDGYARSSKNKPGGKYKITATSYWTVTWTSSSGASGQIPGQITRTSAPASIQIDELQVVTG